MSASLMKWFAKPEAADAAPNKTSKTAEATKVETTTQTRASTAAPQKPRYLRGEAREQALADLRDLLDAGKGTASEAPAAAAPVAEVAPAAPRTMNHTRSPVRQPAPMPRTPESAVRPVTVEISSTAAIGALVRTARQQAGLSQATLAAKAGVGKRFMVELEQGKPTLELAKVLQVLAASGLAFSVGPGASA